MLENPASREECLTALDSFWRLRTFNEVDSTNICIKDAISEGAGEGTCVAARCQTSAYGRQGRTWSSPEGGLYFSFILDPLGAHVDAEKAPADLPAISLLLSLGVQAALSALTKSEAIKIKWPNDIFVVQGDAAAKLCGISLEVFQGKLCCGIGINILPPKTAQTVNIQDMQAQAYLIDLMDDRANRDFEWALNQLLPRVLRSIEKHYEGWLQDGIAPFIGHYNEQLYNRGEQVELEAIDGQLLHAGTVLGAAETGELLLRTASGEIIRANSGEVHTRH